MQTQKNADRFQGFADIYEQARPAMPAYVAEVVRRYTGRVPELVVDLGCGTGLSTLAWEGRCGRVVGIEPSDDMRAVALTRQRDAVAFQKGWSHETGLETACADAVVCSQSFHWMEPAATLAEADRLLKPGGVFAAVDCDWPPVMGLAAERAYNALADRVLALEAAHPELRDTYTRYEKERHLANIKASGRFAYAREIVFHHRETAGAARIKALAVSQGGVQMVLKYMPEAIEADVDVFEEAVDRELGTQTIPVEFCYRIRLGVKG